MEENIKFSIIVPCFNVERYIEECVTSVLKQSYKNWELILVDDGSSDGTYSKICNLADLDERIFAYRKKHSGLPGTRNYALNYVTGDYLVLLDGDDYLAVSHLEEDSKLLRANNVDMLIHNQHTNFTATNKEQIVLFPKSLVAGNQEKLAVVFDVRNYLPASAVLTTYSIKFLKRNGLIYTEKYRCSEDLDFFLNAISKAPEINFAYHEFYFYRQDNSSAMTKKMSIGMELDRLSIYKKWYDFFSNRYVRDFSGENIQRKIAADLCCQVILCKFMEKEDKKFVLKYFFKRNRYLLEKNSFSKRFYFQYYVVGNAVLLRRKIICVIRKLMSYGKCL